MKFLNKTYYFEGVKNKTNWGNLIYCNYKTHDTIPMELIRSWGDIANIKGTTFAITTNVWTDDMLLERIVEDNNIILEQVTEEEIEDFMIEHPNLYFDRELDYVSFKVDIEIIVPNGFDSEELYLDFLFEKYQRENTRLTFVELLMAYEIAQIVEVEIE